jgi:hypothetical protein
MIRLTLAGPWTTSGSLSSRPCRGEKADRPSKLGCWSSGGAAGPLRTRHAMCRRRIGWLIFIQHTKHRIEAGSAIASSFLPPGTPLDRFLEPTGARPDLEQMLIQWVVQTRQPFTVVEHTAFRAILEMSKRGITGDAHKRVKIALDLVAAAKVQSSSSG